MRCSIGAALTVVKAAMAEVKMMEYCMLIE